MKRKSKGLILLVVLLLIVQVPVYATEQAASPKMLYFNGTIYTNDKDIPMADAMVVEDGKFAFVGTYADAVAYAGEDCEQVDLNGQFVSPGFFDGHIHMALQTSAFDFRDYIDDVTPTIEQYAEALRTYLDANPGIPYLRGAGWENASFPDEPPAKEILDAVNADIPIALRSLDYHSLWANSKAIEQAGITPETVVPGDGEGVIEINAQGEVGGMFREPAAFDLVINAFPPVTIEEYKQAVLRTQDMLLAVGHTGVFDAGVYPDSDWYYAYRELANEGKLKLHVSMAFLMFPDTFDKNFEWVKNEINKYKDEVNPKITADTVKFLADGVTESGTSLLKEEYASQPGYFGLQIWEKEKLTDAFKLCDENGFKIHVHTVGDGAVSYVLDCFETLSEESTARRNALCHLQLVDSVDFQRFHDLGIVAVVAPYWAVRTEGYEDCEVKYLGEERVERTYPVRSFIDAGVHTVAHSDYPVTAGFNPLYGIEMAVTRSMPVALAEGMSIEDTTLNPGQAITIEEAIDIFTYQGAYSILMEDFTGSIAVGKSADFAVIDKNILETPASLATVVATYFQGEKVY